MDPLLKYDFSTAPAPLQASTAQAETRGRINVSVTDPSDTVYCNSLRIEVPLGDHGALSTIDNVPVISINGASGWSVISTEIGPLDGESSDLEWAKYTLRPEGDEPDDWKVSGKNLVPSLLAIVNEVAGEFEFKLTEKSGTEPSKLSSRTATFKLSKATPYFYVDNLVAVDPASPTVPKTEFELGKPIQLEWESNGTWFEVFEKGKTAPIYAGTGTSCLLNGGASTDTTFFLVSSVTGDPSGEKPVTGYETVILYDAITVTVSNPALTPSIVQSTGDVSTQANLAAEGNLYVRGTSTLAGATSVTSTLTADSVTANGGVKAAGSLEGTGLGISGDGRVSGSLSAGPATLGPTSVGGNLQAGQISGSGLNISGGVGVGGGLGASSISSGYLALNGGDGNAVYATSSSGQYQIAGFYNRTPRIGNWITGVVSIVSGGGDYGFGTNGQYVTASGNAMLTHLETQTGHRVVTSPLVLEEQVQISGSAQLAGGRASVQLDDEVTDLIVHSEDEGYRVMVTPTGSCAGVAVVEKTASGFVVEELGEGTSDAGFDWLLISPKRDGLHSDGSSPLPDRLPEIAEPSANPA